MAFLNTGFLVSFPYNDVRVLTTALYLCAYLLQLGAQLICCSLSLKLYYFSFDIFCCVVFFFLFLFQMLSRGFLLLCVFSEFNVM